MALEAGRAVAPSGNEQALGIDQLTAPSIQTIQAVYQALRESVERVDKDSRAVLDALRLLGDTLDLAKGSTSMGGGLGLLGPMALPIPLAMRGMMAPVSKYVQQRTGISLYGWMDFVRSTQKQFEEYLAQLEQVATLAALSAAPLRAPHEAAASVAAPEASLAVIDSGAPLRADKTLLLETKAKTRIWRPALTQINQFGNALDALLDGWREETRRFDSAGGKPQDDGWAQNFGVLFQGAAAKVTDQLAGARLMGQNFLLSAFADLGERASQFRDQVSNLSQSFADLEDLLDLEIAQLRARAGELSTEEVDLLRQRVAAAVLVPRLVHQLAAVRAREAAFRTRLQKLGEARKGANISDAARETLEAEYGDGLAAATAQLAALESEAAVWQTQGQPMLQAAAARLKAQQELVRARQLVGELLDEPARARLDALERELSKVSEATRVLESLTQPGTSKSHG